MSNNWGALQRGGLFHALKSYFIRKVSRSITIAMIAMTNIAFSYLVPDVLLHSKEIGVKPPQLSLIPYTKYSINEF